MTITLLCVGKAQTEFHEPAIAEYLKRLRRWVACDVVVIPASSQESEGDKILARLPAGATVVLLDERGFAWSTPELATAIDTWQNRSVKSVVFIIGGAYGVSKVVEQRADHVWSLSRLVFPHELVRVIVSEQLYRAYDVLHGGKYHHG